MSGRAEFKSLSSDRTSEMQPSPVVTDDESLNVIFIGKNHMVTCTAVVTESL